MPTSPLACSEPDLRASYFPSDGVGFLYFPTERKVMSPSHPGPEEVLPPTFADPDPLLAGLASRTLSLHTMSAVYGLAENVTDMIERKDTQRFLETQDTQRFLETNDLLLSISKCLLAMVLLDSDRHRLATTGVHVIVE